MNLTVIDSNKTLVTLYNEVQVLYSYSTPVVLHLPDGKFMRTKVKYSKMTEKHIKTFLGEEEYTFVDQSYIDSFVQHV